MLNEETEAGMIPLHVNDGSTWVLASVRCGNRATFNLAANQKLTGAIDFQISNLKKVDCIETKLGMWFKTRALQKASPRDSHNNKPLCEPPKTPVTA